MDNSDDDGDLSSRVSDWVDKIKGDSENALLV